MGSIVCACRNHTSAGPNGAGSGTSLLVQIPEHEFRMQELLEQMRDVHRALPAQRVNFGNHVTIHLRVTGTEGRGTWKQSSLAVEVHELNSSVVRASATRTRKCNRDALLQGAVRTSKHSVVLDRRTRPWVALCNSSNVGGEKIAEESNTRRRAVFEPADRPGSRRVHCKSRISTAI